MKEKEITGRHVFLIVAAFFLVIIAVNFTMAYKAISTFPGLEVKNSYVASQSFDADRASQLSLGWQVDAAIVANELRLTILGADGHPVRGLQIDAVLGRPTNVKQDRHPEFQFDGQNYVAKVDLPVGVWDLRLRTTAQNSVQFRQQISLIVKPAS